MPVIERAKVEVRLLGPDMEPVSKPTYVWFRHLGDDQWENDEEFELSLEAGNLLGEDD